MASVDPTDLCLDTNVLIAFLKGRDPGASAVAAAVRNANCFVTSISVYELLFGVSRAGKHIGEDQLLSILATVPLDDTAARRAATLHDQLLRAGEDIGIKDVLIAAICLERQLPILTLNEKHFRRVPDLRVYTPKQLLA
jgi:tRNA(fMet)-specific endonuclease VapC